jgi:hypothetical protein
MKKEYDFSKAKRGAVIPQPGKTRITIYLDNDLLEMFRDHAAGRGYHWRGTRTFLPRIREAHAPGPGAVRRTVGVSTFGQNVLSCLNESRG